MMLNLQALKWLHATMLKSFFTNQRSPLKNWFPHIAKRVEDDLGIIESQKKSKGFIKITQSKF